ncbi:unnamed protein product [Ectocarpus fasciculatus]
MVGTNGVDRGSSRQSRGQGGRLLDPSSELEVLKCIMLREGYLARVTRLAEGIQRRSKRSYGQREALPPGMVDLLDLLRVATLETVEAISLWRLSQVTPTPEPFQWNGRNYLMKMLQDCDFLDRVEALRNWLGFQISGNPFFVPQDEMNANNELDERYACRRTSQTAGTGFGFDKYGLADVGRQPWLGPLVLRNVDEGGGDFGREAYSSRRRKQRRLQRTGAINSLAPYAAAVVNDPTLLAAVKASSPTRRGDQNRIQGLGSRTDALELSPRKATVDIEAVVPNLVSRDDACRIGVARKTLMDEQMRVLEAAKVLEADVGVDVGRKRRSRAWSRVSHKSSSAGNFSESLTSTTSAASKRPSTFEEAQVTRRTGSAVGTSRPNPLVASGLPETGDMRSLVLTAAGLMSRPPPDPHPGLGPVVLKSGLPGGQLHPDPFLHTVSDALNASTDGLEQEISVIVPSIRGPETEDRCSTAPSKANSMVASSSTRDVPGGRRRRSVFRRSSVNPRRAVTAPASVSGPSSLPRRSFLEQGPQNSGKLQQDTPISRVPFAEGAETQEMVKPSASDYSSRALGLSRKAGAELRALTAAGTTGRRQPPPREIRLRRLARDVARQAAELRRLVGEEHRLRKVHASSCSDGSKSREKDGDRQLHNDLIFGTGSMETDDDALARMVSVREDGGRAPQGTRINAVDGELPEHLRMKIQTLLDAKRREIELKTFDLGTKRDELGCLRVVQKQERERKLALEMERRRAHLADGQRLPEDEKVAESLEESSCLLLQKRIRGNTGRKYAAWYKAHIHQASLHA